MKYTFCYTDYLSFRFEYLIIDFLFSGYHKTYLEKDNETKIMMFKNIGDNGTYAKLMNGTTDFFGLKNWLLTTDSEESVKSMHISGCNFDYFNCNDGTW